MLFEGGFSFSNFLVDILAVFVFIVWFWLIIAVIGERNIHNVQHARDELRRVIGFSVADEIEKLDRLKKAGTITDGEFARLRSKLVA